MAGGDELQLPNYVRWLARFVAVAAGVLALSLGVWVMFTLSATCLVIGLMQMLVGFVVVTLEAPFCCMWLDFIEKIGRFSDSLAHWHKAAVYCTLGVLPQFLCFELATFLPSVTLFAAGCLYAMLALGRKADRASMLSAAAGSTQRIATSMEEYSASASAWDTNTDDVDNAGLPYKPTTHKNPFDDAKPYP